MQHRKDKQHVTLRVHYILVLTLLLLVISFIPACSSQAVPQAELRASISSGQVPLRVSFINDSKNASEFQWDFGDGSTMTTTIAGQIVTHEYTEVGTHTVKLTAIANGDSVETSTAEITITVKHGPIDYVKLVPDTLELACNQIQQLTAEVMDEYGNPIPEAQITWKVPDNRAGSINSDGVFTAGTKSGSFNKGITVTASQNSHSAQTTIAVKILPGPLDRVKLSPSTLELAPSQSHQFTAEATDAYDNSLPEAELAWKVALGLGIITSDGMFTAGTQAGVFSEGVTVTAELDNVSVDATASVTVKEGSSGTDNITPPVSDNGTGELVTFPDKNLDTAIRTAIGKPEGPIYRSSLVFITSLYAREGNISDLTGLEYCKNLIELNLGINNIKDISPLTSLKNLNSLRLDRNQIDDLSPLANLTKLTYLQLDRNEIIDLSPLANLIYLTTLELQGNQISDVSPLANLTRLTDLIVGYNMISDFSPLGDLTSLTKIKLNDNEINNASLVPLSDPSFLPKLISLEIGHNDITDISPVANRTKLDYLHFDGCDIIDISPVANLINLTSLRLFSNEIVDISPVANLTNLTYISLDQNQITDITPLANLTNLNKLVLGRNKIADISPVANLTNLTILYLEDNRISDISPLVSLTKLNDLRLNGNQIVDISALANLANLTRLYLNENGISDISPLVANIGLTDGDSIDLRNNPLSTQSINDYIPQLETRGVEVLRNP
jgi:internalin A